MVEHPVVVHLQVFEGTAGEVGGVVVRITPHRRRGVTQEDVPLLPANDVGGENKFGGTHVALLTPGRKR
jgi:hypothetical protein